MQIELVVDGFSNTSSEQSTERHSDVKPIISDTQITQSYSDVQSSQGRYALWLKKRKKKKVVNREPTNYKATTAWLHSCKHWKALHMCKQAAIVKN